MRYFLVIWFILISVNSFSQAKRKIPPLVESKSSYKFGRVANISFSERIKSFPFNKAVNIELVSFEDSTGGGQLDTTKIVYNENMPKSYMAVCVNPFKETKKLSLSEIDKLTDIWFNYGPIGSNHVINFGACYSPRNGILFLDEKGKVFDFVEICFGCLRMRNFSKQIDVENECDHKINMIREFFKEADIKYGVIDTKL